MDENEKLTPQQMAIELSAEFTPHDALALGDLSREELVAQYEARQALFDYIDALWDKAKNDGRVTGHDPADQPRFSAIAGLRDLATELLANAENAGGGD